ncbi:acetoacetate--CoA ligase [Metallumcola ferriviriculae]|uniref:Acetoacetate--CoA ligase n=1 Tax=Metallumcola ferriviriculae TaxID=3039180 RepID=A0AAU0UNP3_9FIRM|nr:acetoacetate--CoA ligase [Desulfitibacteraceae bacterium MK1]
MTQPLWQPSEERVKNANMTEFREFINKRYDQTLVNYDQLYQWSIDNREQFWSAIWDFNNVISSKSPDTIATGSDMMECKWFQGARLNFAENLLKYRDKQEAIIFKAEGNEPISITYAELYDKVALLAAAFRDAGVTVGDRVAGFMPNMPETIIAMLATTSIGAIWSSCSPDFGFNGVMDRFGQIEPKVLVAANGYFYNGKTHNSLERVTKVQQDIDSIEKVVIVSYTESRPDISSIPKAVHYEDFTSRKNIPELTFEQLPFDHPLYIMYSSGTTGVPKCIVHGAGGTLIQHLKELVLHTNLGRDDSIFYFTTCGWMMWNWLVSSLAVGATLVLFDGSPFYPEPGVLFKYAQDAGITIFGTSAKYLAALEKAGVKPGKEYDLSKLQAILSTGSPLSVESFHYVYRDIKEDLCLSSISGGTDIVSCFALGNPVAPVYPGELQCRGLGMKVEAYDECGQPVIKQKGELVCTAPFPSQPVKFWNDPEQKKYKSAYFEEYPGIWHHGDYIEVTDTGGIIIYGRSDATLNPGGVRIGTAEIYRQVEAMDEILDSVVIGQEWDNDVRVILFVKLRDGVKFTEELIKRIKSDIRANTTPRHVPAKIIAVPDIPYTISGKKVELAVRKMIHNQPVKNQDALANPEALEYYQDIPELIS